MKIAFINYLIGHEKTVLLFSTQGILISFRVFFDSFETICSFVSILSSSFISFSSF